MKNFWPSFVTNCMSKFFNSFYVWLDLSFYRWKFVENLPEAIWFEGDPLPHPGDIVDESRDVAESSRVGGSRTINDSEIVESE